MNRLRLVAGTRHALTAVLTCLLLLLSESAPANVLNDSRGWSAATPEALGYSSAKLKALRVLLEQEPTTAFLVIVHGKILFSYGDVARPMKVASIRKSILALLYGQAVMEGKIDLTSNVDQLGLQERFPFLPLEKRATLEQLLTARSGIYLDPRTDELGAQAPNRGSEYPGTYFFYGNWQFDAAGTAYEKLTGESIYDALEKQLATPLGMQDFDRSRQKKVTTPTSIHPEYAMYLSPRDLARVGEMMLHAGSWDGKQVEPREWIRYVTSVVTPWDEMNPALLRMRGSPDRWGFGAGWWTWDAQPFPGNVNESPFQGAFEARGSGGQHLTILPARDMVLVHAVDLASHADPREQLDQSDWEAIVELVLATACRASCPSATH
jgi:CubicO group peptidase (beta-lactamase class C family)